MTGENSLDHKIGSGEMADPWRRVARIITNVTVPPFLALPVYYFLANLDQEKIGPAYNLWFNLGLAVTFSLTVPVIIVLVLRSQNKISGVHIPLREQRTFPFALTILSQVAGVVALWLFSGGNRLTTTIICYTTVSLLVLFINFYWKISVHAIGVGGPLAILTVTIGWWTLPYFILLPVVGWARVYLKAHTLGQVIAGGLLGYFFTLLQILLIFQPAGWFSI